MKIKCAKSVLIDYINIVNKAVTGRTTLPILECILLTADENGFRLLANDLELGIETKNIDAEIEKFGSVALNAKMFNDIIRSLPGETVSISVNEQYITLIKSGKSEFKILGLSGEEFPYLTEVEREQEYIVPAVTLRDMIRQTIFSVSKDESKTYMTGELFEISDNILSIVSVDGFRVSLCTFGLEAEIPDISAILPAKTLDEISKILPQEDASEVSIYFTEKHALFDMENCRVVSRLIEGEFMNYRNVFTEDYTTIINVDREQLSSSIDRSSLISRDSKKMPVKLSIAGGRLVITSNTELGNAYDEMSVEQDGVDLEIAFNPKFITDVLKQISEERITMQFTTPLSPCIIKGVESRDFKYLILPLRLKG